MMFPDELMDLDLSVIRISTIILKKLKKEEIIKYQDLLEHLIKKEGENIRYVFVPTLIFLYSIGKVEYHLKTDSIEGLK